ncbi:hypothetical protein D9756_001235 [Leucocoprinus leucothites]|uniref:Uncharacterized protein n=1 Tax=Leucocoprinus leucothites TaxID=201217 RepID=A0A8H5LI20_9AGAR|nr:hypothetical protein D9756_001235 [Leucoagaricus leucothites]
MTEYMASPQVYEEYMTSRERCARWVQTHSSDPDRFCSPSIPLTEIEGFIPSSPPSDAGSSHSLPPKMVLRYNDGRPDIPIPYTSLSSRRHAHNTRGSPSGPPYRPPGHQRSHTTTATHLHPHSSSPIPIHPSHKSNQRHASHNPHPEPIGADAGSPEEIRVLPSQRPAPSPLPPRSAAVSSSHRQRSHHSRSKSLSRADPHFPREDLPAASSHSRPIAYPPPGSHHSHAAPQMNPQAGPAPWHGLHVHSSSSSTKHSRGNSSHKVPPAIVYAPHHGRAPHYTPPAILYHPPQRGPNGMIYSHSAPVPIQGGPYPTPMAPSNYEERGRRDRTRSLGPGRVHKVPRSEDGQGSDAGSVGSGSTYYVLPTEGQKVHVIAPSPGESIHTATSATKSPGPSPKKPFFQRLFDFAKIGSSTGGPTRGPRKTLQRRRSTGDSERPTSLPAHRQALE